jgi:hypothetical protein
MSDTAVFAGFLGTWILELSSCQYEQGDPPSAGLYSISEKDGRLFFTIAWTDAKGKDHDVAFNGLPDGVPVPFVVAGAVDEMSIQAISRRELRSTAFFQSKSTMIAQRQLDESGRTMRVTQVVMFPDGERLANVATYMKSLPE